MPEINDMENSEFISFCWERAKRETLDLWNELISLEYVLTWGYSENKEVDSKRYKEIQTIIYKK